MRSITRFVAAFSIATLTSSIASAAHVCGTDPNGDYFLSLRTGPGSGYRELARLVEGTYIRLSGARVRGFTLAPAIKLGTSIPDMSVPARPWAKSRVSFRLGPGQSRAYRQWGPLPKRAAWDCSAKRSVMPATKSPMMRWRSIRSSISAALAPSPWMAVGCSE
jgi:hypothetical protein